MQVRKAVSPSVVKLANVMTAVGSPEKATHQQRATAIRELVEIANSSGPDDGVDRITTYGAIAVMACIDSTDPQTVIGYANNAIGDEDDDALALRARMYLQAGDRNKALDDLEKIMVDDKGHALVGGDADPRKDSAPCGWSIADLDALGDDPRAFAAKGLYLSSFIAYNAEQKGTVKESNIRDLYARSATSWHSPIPHFLNATTVDGLGSQHSMAGAGCGREQEGDLSPGPLIHEVHGVQPALLVQIRCVEWTAENRLRHARFLGLRDDKVRGGCTPRALVAPTPSHSRHVPLASLEAFALGLECPVTALLLGPPEATESHAFQSPHRDP